MTLKTYTIHLPAIAMRGDPRALERARIVRDGFSWSAFAFTVLWFLYHRLWVGALIVLAFLAAVAVGGRFAGLSTGAAFVVTLLASFLIGLEASSLRRWTYGRRGLPARDAVVATSLDEAEAKAFARWLDPDSITEASFGRSGGRRADDSVIGLFPASEGGR